MTQKTKGIILWIVATIFTLSIAVYQRSTGPTYPAKGSIEFSNHQLSDPYSIVVEELSIEDEMITSLKN